MKFPVNSLLAGNSGVQGDGFARDCLLQRINEPESAPAGAACSSPALSRKLALERLAGLPIAAIWGDGTTSSSDGQFFRSAKRGDAAGAVNARYGHDPGFSFYTHLSDQHGPYSIKVMSATNHEAPYVLDGLLHQGTLLKIDTHYTDTGGASDHVFILCALLGFRFCPRLRDLPIEGSVCSPIFSASHVRSECRGRAMVPLSGARIKSDARPPMI